MGNFEAVRLVEDLARRERSILLAQLASRMALVIRPGGRDPFEKAGGLISEMVAKLEKEAGAGATKKAYCSKVLKEAKEKKLDKTTDLDAEHADRPAEGQVRQA